MTTQVALLSDVHGNSPALQAVLNDIRSQGCTKVFMLGDIINGVDPHGCIQLLQEWCETNAAELTCLKGNGEEYLLTPDRARCQTRIKNGMLICSTSSNGGKIISPLLTWSGSDHFIVTSFGKTPVWYTTVRLTV